MNHSEPVSPVQVSAKHYRNASYDTFERWSSYWYQLDAIRRANPQTLLEIGVGTGLTTWYARERMGIDVTTCDFDPALRPDVVADVRKLTEAILDRKFEMAVAFQVLEHLPFSEFPQCLKQLAAMTTRRVVISLPHTGWRWGLSARIRSHVWKFGYTIAKPKDWDFQKQGIGEHYWEIGVKGASLKIVKQVIASHFRIDRVFMVPENPYHCFFELSPG